MPAQRGAFPAIAFALLVLVLAALLAWREEASLDFGFHLATGRYILEHRAWPATDPFTYTVANHSYTDMNGFFQVLLALAYRAAGFAGVGVLRGAFVLASCVLMWATALRRGARSPALLAAGFTLGLLAWEIRFFARPELATYLLLALQLFVLERHAATGRRGWLAILVPLQLLWVYSHTLSLLGIAVVGLYALTRHFEPGADRRAPWAALIACAAVMFLNPYGWEGLRFLWHLRTRLESENVFAGSISELSSPFAPGTPGLWPLLAFKTLFVATLGAALLDYKRRRAFELALVLVFGALAAASVRSIGLFVVACLPIGLAAAQSLVDPGRWKAPAGRKAIRTQRKQGATRQLGAPVRWLGRFAPVAVALAILFIGLQVIRGGYYTSDRRPEAFGVAPSAGACPVATVEFIRAHHLQGPIYNHLNFGGYLLGERWPEEKVFIDGRLEVMGEDFFRKYLAINSGPGWDGMMRRYDPRLALIPHTSIDLLKRLARDPAWALVEVDGVAALFVRRVPENMALVAEAARGFQELNLPVAADSEALAPRRPPSPLQRLVGARRFPWAAWGRANGLYGLGLYQAARREYRRALVMADRDEIPLVTNYAAAVFRLGRRDEARAWYRRLLELEPGNRLARDRLSSLGLAPGPGSFAAPR